MTDETPKRGPGRPPKVKTVLMRVERDYWPGPEAIEAGWPETDDGRVRRGTVVDLEPEAAMDGLETGMLSRVKD